MIAKSAGFCPIGIDYCAYMQHISSFANDRFFVIDYKVIKENPYQVIMDLYNQMGLDLPPEVEINLQEISKENKIKGKHHYS